MEISTYYGKELAITGSEISYSHRTKDGKTAYSIDIGTNQPNGNRTRYAPFTCKVVAINTKYNTLYCESVEPVICPRFMNGTILCFGIGHLKELKYKVGDIIQQGEVLGQDWYTGLSDKTAIHTHWSFGVGSYKGLHKLGNYLYDEKEIDGVYAISSDGYIHSYDFFFIENDCKITTAKDNPAYEYQFVRFIEEPIDYKSFYDRYHPLIEAIVKAHNI